jgi:hypothetical protein
MNCSDYEIGMIFFYLFVIAAIFAIAWIIDRIYHAAKKIKIRRKCKHDMLWSEKNNEWVCTRCNNIVRK